MGADYSPVPFVKKHKKIRYAFLACVIIGSVLIILGTTQVATSKPQEIKAWDQVSLCLAGPVTLNSVNNWRYYSRDLPTGGVCPSTLVVSTSGPQRQRIVYDASEFESDYSYDLILFRSSTSTVTMTYSLTNSNGVTLAPTRRIIVKDDAVNPTTSLLEEGVVAVPANEALEVEEGIGEHSAGRHLLKSAGGSGRSTPKTGSRTYRPKTGSGSTYSRTTPRRTTYGRTGRSAVVPSTVIWVRRRGRFRRNSERDNELAGSDDDCERQGCEDEVDNFLSRDEVSMQVGLTQPAQGGDKVYLDVTAEVTMPVLQADAAVGANETIPELYLTFASKDSPPKEQRALALIPIGLTIIIVGVVVVFWSRHRARRQAQMDPGTAATHPTYYPNSPDHGHPAGPGPDGQPAGYFEPQYNNNYPPPANYPPPNYGPQPGYDQGVDGGAGGYPPPGPPPQYGYAQPTYDGYGQPAPQ
eukprot:TRINITY_DN8412_c0_g1_i1.p1 TRINITY_DN8412_c0_g1~~TRINITY_DN8412_c0_g1_i1.p1  ORF type:complete len:468 (-),score=78.50 TRINITY_DN8412_c0_g1_i1:90-1493(-)